MTSTIDHFTKLAFLLTDAECSLFGKPTLFQGIVQAFSDTASRLRPSGKIIFIGNGGSAGICSHMAIDFSKRGKIPSVALTDGAALTCLGNDIGFENVFGKQIEWHAQPGDLLVAISSSGRSPNILCGVDAARAKRCNVMTLSGFDDDNPLRRRGDMNIYVRASDYGLVEVAHHALLHAVLDLGGF